MEFSYDNTVEELQARTLEFLNEQVLPAEPSYQQQRLETAPWGTPPVMARLKAEAEQGYSRTGSPTPGSASSRCGCWC